MAMESNLSINHRQAIGDKGSGSAATVARLDDCGEHFLAIH